MLSVRMTARSQKTWRNILRDEGMGRGNIMLLKKMYQSNNNHLVREELGNGEAVHIRKVCTRVARYQRWCLQSSGKRRLKNGPFVNLVEASCATIRNFAPHCAVGKQVFPAVQALSNTTCSFSAVTRLPSSMVEKDSIPILFLQTG